FFFQAEDGIRDLIVTGVQTCALPILLLGVFTLADTRGVMTSSTRVSASVNTPSSMSRCAAPRSGSRGRRVATRPCRPLSTHASKIGRASCREEEKKCGPSDDRTHEAV